MSNSGDNGSWNPQGHENGAPQDPYAQPQQDPWAQPPAEQPAGQDAYGQQDPYGQQEPYGQPAAEHPDGQDAYGQQDPYGQPPAGQPAGQDAYGQQDPYGQPSANSASGPYGQGQQAWTPTPGSGASASDPYAQGGAAYGQTSAGQAPYTEGAAAAAGEPQSRLVVGLLGIFLGGFGVHRFLLGYTTIGIIQIVVTILTCGFGAWWGLVEGIMVLAKAQAFERDAHGRPLRD